MPPSSAAEQTASVVICAYTMSRWDDLRAAIDSVRGQSRPPLETIVVIDHNDELYARAAAEFSGLTVVANVHDRGLSGGRRTGAELAAGTVVAFLDDDAVADRDWLERLLPGYADPLVLGVGGPVEPAWQGEPPRWLPEEFAWIVGCTYRGMAVDGNRIRNPIGANMSVRAGVLDRVGKFDPRLGRGAAAARRQSGAAEETEFALRASREHPGHYWIYEPGARVLHNVPAERTRRRYFAARCIEEGRAKALLASIAGSDQGLEAERAYVRSVLPRAVAREVGRGLRGHPDGFERAAAVIGGVTLTAAAYAWSRGAAALRRS